MTPDAGFMYGPDDYFAFVESIDPLTATGTSAKAADHVMNYLLMERRGLQLPPPSDAVWIDCVEASYFMRLGWKDEPCRIGNPVDAANRRAMLSQLDRSKFRVGLCLIDRHGAAEQGTALELTRSTWHRISLTMAEGIPTMTGIDFDLDANTQQVRYLRYLGRVSELERKSLLNVFSLDFLPNARLQGRERDSPNEPPRTPIRPREEIVEPVRQHVYAMNELEHQFKEKSLGTERTTLLTR